jgi:hypothetical protein
MEKKIKVALGVNLLLKFKELNKVEGLRFFVQNVRININFFLFLLINTCIQVSASEFIYGLEEIPVYKEMEYVDESNVLFDKINGRFVSSEIIGDYNAQEIKLYYSSVLPNLGWHKISESLFERGREYLEITVLEENSMSKVKFSIFPKE